MTTTRGGFCDREDVGPGTVGDSVLRRRLLAAFVGVVLLVCLAGRLLFIQGWFRPVRISGGSMAETLVGRHLTIRCRDCRFLCRVDAEAPPGDGCVVCPNCGQRNHDSDKAGECRGDRVLLDRLAYRWRSPRRWELVAFHAADDDDFFAVKRVVGLPGETVSIRGGDIYIDGRIQRKTLDQLRDMAFLVHDADFQPVEKREELPRRWRSESTSSCWRQCGTKWQFSTASVPNGVDWGAAELPITTRSVSEDIPQFPASVLANASGCYETNSDDELKGTPFTSVPTAQTDWLAYHHWRCMKGPWSRTDEYAILDNYGYNQSVSRQLHRVSDLLLVCRTRVSTGSGSLKFSVHDGHAWFDISLSLDSREAQLVCGQRNLASAALPPLAYAQGVMIEVAVCDRQVLLAIEGRLVLRVPYEVGDLPFEPTGSPLRIGATGAGATVQRLQIFRDIHYLGPRGLSQPWTSFESLERDELFVIGDNVPISRDSRHGERPGVPEDRLLGRVLCVW